MPRRLVFAFGLTFLLAAASLGLAGCSDDDSDSGGASPTEAPTRAASSPTTAASNPTSAPAASPTTSSAATPNTMTIANFAYTPASIQARVGQQVRLTVTNQDSAAHTFTIQGVVDSGTLSQGQSKVVEFTPNQAGTLTFFCTIHGQGTMSGRVTVQGSSGALPPSEGDGQASGGAGSGGSAPVATDYGY